MPKHRAKIPITQRNTLNRKKVKVPPLIISWVTKYFKAMPPNEISKTEKTSKAPMMTSMIMAKILCSIHPFISRFLALT